jgi:hypothetical protein
MTHLLLSDLGDLAEQVYSITVLGTDNCWYEVCLGRCTSNWIDTNWKALSPKQTHWEKPLEGCHVLYENQNQLDVDTNGKASAEDLSAMMIDKAIIFALL